MTLVELIVALSIGGVALAAGFGMLAAMVDHHDRAAAASDALSRVLAERRTLASWIAGARLDALRPDASFQGLDGLQHGQPGDHLSFLTSSPTPLGGPTLVRLLIDRDPDTPEEGLVAHLVALDGRSRHTAEIDSTITSLDIRYRSSLDGNPFWTASWISSTVLPLAVELRFGATPHPTQRTDAASLLTRLPLLVPVGAGP